MNIIIVAELRSHRKVQLYNTTCIWRVIWRLGCITRVFECRKWSTISFGYHSDIIWFVLNPMLKIEIVCQTPEHHQKASKPPWIYFEHQELFLLHEVDIKIHLTINAGVAFYSGFGCRGGVSCVQSRFLFLISSLSKFIIFIVIFSHHVVQITFYSWFQYVLKLLFIPNFEA